MSKKPLPIVDAELQSDLARMDKIIKETPADDPNLKYYVAIRESRRARDRSPQEMKDSLRALSGLLEPPPRDAELFQILLMRIVRLASGASNIGEALRALRLMEQAGGGSARRPEMQAGVLLSGGAVHYLARDFQAARRDLDRALEIIGPRRDRQWLSCKGMRLQVALYSGDLDTAEGDLADIGSLSLDGVLTVSPSLLKAHVLAEAGRDAEALAVLEAAPPETSEFGRRSALGQRIRLLFYLGRRAEARGLLAAEGAGLAPHLRQELELVDALLEGRIEEARAHGRQGLVSPGVSPVMIGSFTQMLAAVELAARRPRAARLLLANIDPEASGLRRAMEWMRLYLLEGDESRAIGHLRRLLALNRPELVCDGLMTAHELSAARFARLWKMALQPEPAGASAALDVPAAKPRPPRARPEQPGKAELVGESPAMREVRARIAQYAPLAETVLITGETGTGKEMVARQLHFSSPRAEQPFLAVNCAAISDTLLESELFGHAKGAFTGAERAHEGLLVAVGRGTIFFDEIGLMSPRVQASLLRVLEERKVRPVGGTSPVPVEARVVAATNRPLEELVQAGAFRQDLYYRLARLEIRLPPLRDRLDDVPLLARSFLQKFFDYGDVALGDDLLAALRQHDWPGNVRELDNEIQRIAILAGDARVLGAGLFRGQAAKGDSQRRAAVPEPASGPPAETAIRGARGRMIRLRRIFQEHRELSRADVAQLLGCAPATAAGLLAALEAEGLVVRVRPTAAPRTHYFRLKPPG